MHGVDPSLVLGGCQLMDLGHTGGFDLLLRLDVELLGNLVVGFGRLGQ